MKYKILGIILILLSIHFFYKYYNAVKLPLKKGENINQSLYFSNLYPVITGEDSCQYFFFVYCNMFTISCSYGRYLYEISAYSKLFKNIKVFILLPTEYSQNDVDVFNINFDFGAKFIRIKKDFNKNDAKALGSFSFILDKKGYCLYSEILNCPDFKKEKLLSTISALNK